MGAPIGPGDWVECVDARPPYTPCDSRLVLGRLYLVDAVNPTAVDPDGRVDIGLKLTAPETRLLEDSWWDALRFRPIYSPDPKLIERLMEAPVTEPVADPVAIAEAAYDRALAEQAAWLRGPFAEQLASAFTLNALADVSELFSKQGA